MVEENDTLYLMLVNARPEFQGMSKERILQKLLNLDPMSPVSTSTSASSSSLSDHAPNSTTSSPKSIVQSITQTSKGRDSFPSPLPSSIFLPPSDTNPLLDTSLLGSLVGSFNHLSLCCRDSSKSLAFYQTVLGATLINRPQEMGCHGYWLWLGNIQLHLIEYPEKVLTPIDNNAGTRVNHFSFDCNEFDECEKRLKANSIPYKKIFVIADRKQNKGVNQVFFQDPDNNYIELCDCRLIDNWVYANTGVTKSSASIVD